MRSGLLRRLLVRAAVAGAGALSLASPAAALPPNFQETTVLGGLTQPMVVRFAPDGRVFVAEKSGLIRIFDSLADTTPSTFADLRTNVHNFWDRGMLGMALDPQFPTRPYVYVLYTYDGDIGGLAPKWGSPGATSDPCPTPPGATADGCVVAGRLSRLTAAGNVMTGSEQVLVEGWCQQYPSHSLGSLQFGADGALYASSGDGASFTFADHGQDGSPLNPCGDPPGGVGAALTRPSAEGGALRSQDLRTGADPAGLDGSIIRVDPDTGQAVPTNPLWSSSDANARRIVAYGLRNPFRFTIRPGTNDLWIGDVGWNAWEEINRLENPTAGVLNFGWPCYEGPGRQPSYDNPNIAICEGLYAAGAGAHASPFFPYDNEVVPNESCPAGSSSISGLAFYTGGTYPADYDDALFFTDYSRECLWVMRKGPNGLPNPATVATFHDLDVGLVHLEIGPGGDLFAVDFDESTVRRYQFFGANQPPTAVAAASPTGGPVPLTVQFDGTGSSDPDPGDSLSYAWDLDGDGQFDDSTAAQPSFTYTQAGTVVARLRVTDESGDTDTDTVTISPGNTPPNATIATPSASARWSVDELIAFSGSATDGQQGSLPASALAWDLVMHHCPSNCHTHPIQSFPGVASGSFRAPDHEYPSHLELRLTATDSGGLTDTETLTLDPRTVDLTFQSSPSGLQLNVGASPGTTPFTRTVIVGSRNSIGAPSPQSLGGTGYTFSSWSDGGSQSHDVTAPAGPATYTATFTAGAQAPPGLVAAYGFGEGAGPTVADASGNGHTGTITGALWQPAGKNGGALTFDGVNDWVQIADANDLDLTTGMTLSAWVRPTVATGWRTVIFKAQPATISYGLYANDSATRPNTEIYVGGAIRRVRGPAAIPAGAWTHLAATYDNSAIRLYVGGTQVATIGRSGPIVTSANPLYLGGNPVWPEWFTGDIDDVRIYNRALSPAEVQGDMATAVDTTPPEPPDPPSGLAATGGVGTVALTWTAPGGPVDHYNVHRSTTAGFTPTAANRIAQPTVASFTDGGLAPGTYHYVVTAQGPGGATSGPSNEAHADVTADTEAPTAPVLDATGGADSVSLSWSASSDNVGVHRYNVHRSTAPGFTPAAANRIAQPTGTTLQDGGLAPGTYYYVVTAEDAAGNTAGSNEAAALVTGETQPPTVSVTSPAPGSAVSGTVTVTAAASDNVGVVGVQFFVDGTAVGSEDTSAPYSFAWDTLTASGGGHSLTARARDANDNQTTSTPVAVTVDNELPTATLTAPAAGATVSGTVEVSADAADNLALASVQFLVDGVAVGSPDTTAPYSLQWATSGVPNGPHDLSASARDTAGNTVTSVPVQVTVQNTGPPALPGLVAAYGFNEGGGSTAADAAGADNPGTLSGASWSPSGRYGGALSFDGVDDRVVVPDAAALDLTTGMTLSAWVNPALVTGWRTVILKEQTDTLSYALYANDNASRPNTEIFVGAVRRLRGPAQLAANQWVHLAATYDNAAIRLFVGGAQVATIGRNGSIAVSTGPLSIGGNAVWPEWFSGLIDEVRVYNRALSQAEIQQDMATPVQP